MQRYRVDFVFLCGERYCEQVVDRAKGFFRWILQGRKQSIILSIVLHDSNQFTIEVFWWTSPGGMQNGYMKELCEFMRAGTKEKLFVSLERCRWRIETIHKLFRWSEWFMTLSKCTYRSLILKKAHIYNHKSMAVLYMGVYVHDGTCVYTQKITLWIFLCTMVLYMFSYIYILYIFFVCVSVDWECVCVWEREAIPQNISIGTEHRNLSRSWLNSLKNKERF